MTGCYRLVLALLLLSCSGSSSPTAPERPEIDVEALATCAQVSNALAAEQAYIQFCTRASECGQALIGTSCGCTRDLVARLDADPARYYDILARGSALDCRLGFITPCDCPPADGFACVADRCDWNYTGG